MPTCYAYEETVTKTRVLIASGIAWILSTVVLIFYFIDFSLFKAIQYSFIIIFMVLITICSVAVYSEARRHERQIAELQASVEARKKFLKEKRARKLTRTTIIVKMFVSYLPVIAFGIIKNVLKDRV